MSTEIKPFGYPVSWIHDAELLEIPPRARHLLEHYAGIPPPDQLPHINAVAQALQTYPYPCLGHYRFLDIQLPRATTYAYITNRLSSGATLLDLGSCIGQELRYLAFSFPHLRPSQLYGLDIKPSFFDVGHALFHDRESFGATFLQADLFDEQEGAGLASLKGKIDIVWTASVIHLWGLERQVLALRVMLALLEGTEEPVLAGRLMGFSEAGELFWKAAEGFKGWRIEIEALEWEETLKIRTAEEPGTTWDLQIKFVAPRGER